MERVLGSCLLPLTAKCPCYLTEYINYNNPHTDHLLSLEIPNGFDVKETRLPDRCHATTSLTQKCALDLDAYNKCTGGGNTPPMAYPEWINKLTPQVHFGYLLPYT